MLHDLAYHRHVYVNLKVFEILCYRVNDIHAWQSAMETFSFLECFKITLWFVIFQVFPKEFPEGATEVCLLNMEGA